jgi:hypothetical protein
MFSPSLHVYQKRLQQLKKYRAKLGMEESLSLQLLLDEVKLILEAAGE